MDDDPITGVRKIHHYDPVTDGSVIETRHDVTALVEMNKALANGVDERAGWKGDLHRVASIPMALFYSLKADGVIDDPKRMKAWLNSSDNRVFRTRPGRI